MLKIALPHRVKFFLYATIIIVSVALFASQLISSYLMAHGRDVKKEGLSPRIYSEKWLEERTILVQKLGHKEQVFFKKVHCSLLGVFCHDDFDSLSSDSIRSSVAGNITTLIMYPFANAPASGMDSVKAAFVQAGFISDVHAAGFGVQVLSPFAAIWKQMRNIAYAIMVVMVIFEAFALMFQSKTGSKESISVETFLPKLILVMILIQFSFTIAGFMIDLMYIVSLVILIVFSPFMSVNISYKEFLSSYLFSTPPDLPNVIFDSLLGRPNNLTGFAPTDLAERLFQHTITLVTETSREIINIFGVFIGTAITIIIDGIVVNWLLNILGGGALPGTLLNALRVIALGGGLASIAAGAGLPFVIPWVIVGVFLIFLVFVTVWRVFMLMLKTYIMVIALTIFSPLIILMELLPGDSFGVKSWIKSFISELVVYPVIFSVFFFLYVLHAARANGVTSLTLPYMSPINGGITFLIGFTVLSLLPNIIEDVRRAIAQSIFQNYEPQLGRNFDTANLWARRAFGVFQGTNSLGRRIVTSVGRGGANPNIPPRGGGIPTRRIPRRGPII